MSTQRANLLRQIIQSITGPRIFGLRMGIDPDGKDDDFLLPLFEDRVWWRPIETDRLESVPSEMLEELASSTETAVFVDSSFGLSTGRRQPIPTQPGVRLETQRGPYNGSAATMHCALKELSAGTTVAFFHVHTFLWDEDFRAIRTELSEDHQLAWLVLFNLHGRTGQPTMPYFILLVCDVGQPKDDVTRLVDLRECPPAEWEREIRSARSRRGGEVGHSIVIPRSDLDNGPWTYERFSKAYRESRSDSRTIGEPRRLRDLMLPISSQGIRTFGRGQITKDLSEASSSYRNFLPIIRPSDIQRNSINTVHFWATNSDVPESALAEPGDLVFRADPNRGSDGRPRVIAASIPSGWYVGIEAGVIRLRWKPTASESVREFVRAWLMSDRASHALTVAGVKPYLSASILLDLEVPYPNTTILSALTELAELEAWYRARAKATHDARMSVVTSRSYAEAVPLLLDAQRAEAERVTAAEDSQRFEYRVRNYFPHPIALRRERLEVLPHGKERLGEALECAEHLVHYLALCGLVQLHTMNPEAAIPSKSLASTAKDGALRMTWGTSWQVLREAVASTTRASDVLALPIPQLTLLEGLTTKKDTPGSRAEAMLRNQRNSESHLHRMPEPDLRELSESVSAALDEMLEAVRFLADLPLVFVRDYAIDPFTGERSAVFEFLRGASVVFERRRQRVKEELPRGCLGLLGHDGRFHRLAPWLHLHTCELCKRPEVFVFNRKERAAVTYVAMETGHPWADPRMVEVFDRLLNAA